MQQTWNVRYEQYGIEDGCPHVEEGQTLDWLVAFWAEERLAISDLRAQSAGEVGDYRYAIAAEVIYLSDKAGVIDFGLKAIGRRELLPEQCRAGDFVSGIVGIELPVCTEIVPEHVLKYLDYTWAFDEVLADVTPWLEHQIDSGGILRTRNVSRVRYQRISSTEQVEANSYILRGRTRSKG